MNQKWDELEVLKKRIKKDKKKLATIMSAEKDKKNNQEEQLKTFSGTSSQKNNKNLDDPIIRNDKENLAKNFKTDQEEKNNKKELKRAERKNKIIDDPVKNFNIFMSRLVSKVTSSVKYEIVEQTKKEFKKIHENLQQPKETSTIFESPKVVEKTRVEQNQNSLDLLISGLLQNYLKENINVLKVNK